MIREQEKALIELLMQVKDTLDKCNVEFWLDHGTLLGAVREKKFLEWEYDIDFGSWNVSDSVKKLIMKELNDKGFKTYNAHVHMHIEKIEGVFADINFYSSIRNKAVMSRIAHRCLFIGRYVFILLQVLSEPYYYKIKFSRAPSVFIRNIFSVVSRLLPAVFRKLIYKAVFAVYKIIGTRDVSLEVPVRYFRNMPAIIFYGMEFRVPAETEGYLAFRYGTNWRIPTKDWVTDNDDGAVKSIK